MKLYKTQNIIQMITRYLLIIISILFLWFSGKAQEDTLTIEKALEIAKKNNPQLHQLIEQKEQKRLSKKISTGIESPEIVYFKEGLNKDASEPFAEQRISITQRIDFPLETYYRLRALENEHQAMNYLIESYKKQLVADVKKQYVKVLYANHIHELRNKQITLYKQMHNAVSLKMEMGEATEMQLLSIEVQLNQSRNTLHKAEQILHNARYNLFDLMGLDSEKQKYSINFSDTLRTYEKYINQDTALNYVKASPQMELIKKQIEASTDRIREARMNYFPDINFSYYQQDYGTGYEYNGYEVGISIPLWGAFNKRGHVQIQQARNRELNYKKYQTELKIKKEIEQAWHGYEALKQSIKRYEDSIRTKATKLYNKNLEAYRLGQIDLIELLDAQRIYLDTEATYLQSLRDYYLQMIDLEKYTNHKLVY